MTSFLHQAKENYHELEYLHKEMLSSFQEVTKYYGEDPNKTSPDDFFNIFKTFVISWEVSYCYSFIIIRSLNKNIK